MIKYRALFILTIVAAVLTACTTPVGTTTFGSGKVVDQEYALSDFDQVEAGGAFRVDIRQGESYRVTVRVDDNLVECLDVRKVGRTLHIGFKSTCWISNATAMEAEIVMPALTGLDLSGATRTAIGGFDSDQSLDLEISGASSLEGDIAAGTVSGGISGASRLELAGHGGRLTLNVSGASHVDLSDFPVGDAKVEVSGASSATVAPSGRLDAEASGASHVYYLGSPTMGTIESSGGSSIQSK